MKPVVFGTKQPDAIYQERYAVYVIIEDSAHEKIAIIEAPNASFFLPGGEIENEETKEQALARELLEEMGVTAEIAGYLGEAAEYFYSRYRKTHYYNPGYFYFARAFQQVAPPTETTNTIWWVKPEEAQEKLKRKSHRWAVEQWLEVRKQQ